MPAFLLTALFSAWVGRADGLDSWYLHQISRSQSGSEVEKSKTLYETLKVGRTACRIQLREHTVPSACYEVLSLAAGHFSAAKTRNREFLRILDEHCADACHKLRVEKVSERFLSTEC